MSEANKQLQPEDMPKPLEAMREAVENIGWKGLFWMVGIAMVGAGILAAEHGLEPAVADTPGAISVPAPANQ